MKIKSVRANNRSKSFVVGTSTKSLRFPYVLAEPSPTVRDGVARVVVDPEADREAFTYELASGREGTIHVEQVLAYNQDPGYLRDQLLYKMTLEVRKRIERSPLSKREIIRRLGTFATQLYRRLDQRNTRKSIDQMMRLLHVLDCDVALVVRANSA